MVGTVTLPVLTALLAGSTKSAGAGFELGTAPVYRSIGAVSCAKVDNETSNKTIAKYKLIFFIILVVIGITNYGK